MILLFILGILAFGYGIWYSNKTYNGILSKDWAYVISPLFMTIIMFSISTKFIVLSIKLAIQ